MNDKQEPLSFTDALIQHVTAFMQTPEAITAIEAGDVSRLFNTFDCPFNATDYNNITNAHEQGLEPFIYAIATVFQPINCVLFNDDLTMLREPFASAITTNLYEDLRINVTGALEDLPEPLKATYMPRREAHIDALLTAIRQGNHEATQHAIAEFKARIEEDNLSLITDYRVYDFEHPEEKINLTPAKISLFMARQAAQLDAITNTLENVDHQFLVDKMIKAVAVLYTQAIVDHATKNSPEKPEQREELKEKKEKEKEKKTEIIASLIAGLGNFADAIIPHPEFRQVFNNAPAFIAKQENLARARDTMLHHKKNMLILKQQTFIAEIDAVMTHLQNNHPNTVIGHGAQNIVQALNQLQAFRDHIHQLEPLAYDPSMHQDLNERFNNIHALIQPEDTSAAARLQQNFEAFLNWLLHFSKYTYLDATTAQTTLTSAVTELSKSATTFEKALDEIKPRDGETLPPQNTMPESTPQPWTTFKTTRSPVDLQNPHQGTRDLQQDWYREQGQGRVTINGESLTDCAARYNNFSTEADVHDFFERTLLQDMDASEDEKQSMIDYLTITLHQGGLLYPVSSSLGFALTEQNEAGEHMPFASLDVDATAKTINITTTPQGFKINEQVTAHKLMVFDPTSPLLTEANNPPVLEASTQNNPLMKAKGTVHVDFSHDPKRPTLHVEKNTMRYGHQALAEAIEKRPLDLSDECSLFTLLFRYIKETLGLNCVKDITEEKDVLSKLRDDEPPPDKSPKI